MGVLRLRRADGTWAEVSGGQGPAGPAGAGVFVWEQPDEPTAAKVGDVWVDTDASPVWTGVSVPPEGILVHAGATAPDTSADIPGRPGQPWVVGLCWLDTAPATPVARRYGGRRPGDGTTVWEPPPDRPLVAVRAATQNSSATALTIPAAVQVGDLMLLSAYSQTTQTPADPSGWTRLALGNTADGSGAGTWGVWWRRAQAGDAGTAAPLPLTGTYKCQQVAAWSGVGRLGEAVATAAVSATHATTTCLPAPAASWTVPVAVLTMRRRAESTSSDRPQVTGPGLTSERGGYGGTSAQPGIVVHDTAGPTTDAGPPIPQVTVTWATHTAPRGVVTVVVPLVPGSA